MSVVSVFIEAPLLEKISRAGRRQTASSGALCPHFNPITGRDIPTTDTLCSATTNTRRPALSPSVLRPTNQFEPGEHIILIH